jgi:hypothetical protein
MIPESATPLSGSIIVIFLQLVRLKPSSGRPFPQLPRLSWMARVSFSVGSVAEK